MSSYNNASILDTGVRSTENSSEVRANVRLWLAAGGEAGILVEEAVSPGVMPRFKLGLVSDLEGVRFPQRV